jgi:hypothetical protein
MDNENEEEAGAPKRLIDTTPLPKEQQIEMAQQLQAMTLRLFIHRVEHGLISDTGLATIVRMLNEHGWDLDPAHVKKDLLDQLTTRISPEELDAELDGVLPLRRNA